MIANTQSQKPVLTAKKKRENRFLLGCIGLIIGLVVLFGIIGGMSDSKPDDSQSSQAANPSNSTGEAAVAEADLPLAVKASELFNAYQNNEASAQKYFGDRKLFVTGIVSKVSLDFSNDAIVELRTPNQFMNVHASLADDSQEAGSNYNGGDKATLLCDDISEIASIPILKDCRPASPKTKTLAIQYSK